MTASTQNGSTITSLQDSLQWEGHWPTVGPKIVRNVQRPPLELLEKFKTAFTPDLSDHVGALYTMDSAVRALYQNCPKLVGIALTVKIPRTDNTSVHEALRWVQPGDVLVVDARGDTESCGTGAGSLMPPIDRGLAGVVVDGAWRDIAELEAIDFPIYGRAISPFSPPKRRPGEINVPVNCFGVIVHPGDIVVCDAEGGVVIPQAYAERIANELKDYSLKTSVKDWDLERIRGNSDKRNVHFDEMFRARGGEYVG